jgi:hypothetical protein
MEGASRDDQAGRHPGLAARPNGILPFMTHEPKEYPDVDHG